MARKVTEESYKIRFVDKILDPVHGFVDLTQVESEIIALPIFKRMQSLKQLSLTDWVFPGAVHTRYMHSIGVMHIANLMALHLRDLNDMPKFNDGQRQIIRLAALLHDIGHYPLSHITEYVYNDNLLMADDVLQSHNIKTKRLIDELKIKNTSLPDYMKARYSKPMHHETMGTKVIDYNQDIKQIISKYCPFIDIDDIKDIIVGCVDRNPSISAMVQLIHSELDADGIDYIMRDASFSGTSYGGIELGLLLRNLTVSPYNGIDIVGVREKGIAIVDQYLISKYFSYTQVIFNKHVAIYNTIAELFSKNLIKLDKSDYPKAEMLDKYIENHNTNDEFLKFTDRAFWKQLDEIKNDDLHGILPEYAELMYHKLLKYQEFDMSKSGEIVITSDKIDDVVEELNSSKIYKRLAKSYDSYIWLFHKKGFTSQIKVEDFRKRLQNLYSDEEDEKFEEKFRQNNVKRLQEGVAVIGGDREIHLLVDNSKSLMSHMHDTNTYIFREYELK